MAVSFLLDTNIFVYAYGGQDARKQQISLRLIRQAHHSDGAISSQVIQEFCNAMVTKFTTKVTVEDADELLRIILYPLWLHKLDIEFYHHALALKTQHNLSYYDSLIVQAAIDLDCDTLYTEDLQSDRRFGRLTIVNPFK